MSQDGQCVRPTWLGFHEQRTAGTVVTEQVEEYERGLTAVGSASSALDGAGLDHWFFGGWAVDLWAGRLTRSHDDIDVLVWRRDQSRIDEALTAAGWVHKPSPEDVVGTNYARVGFELQLTFAVAGADGSGMVVPVPDQPIVLSTGPLAFARRDRGGVSVRVLTIDQMLAIKSHARPDEVGGEKDRADLAVLRSLEGR